MLGCQKYKLDRLLTKALAELPHKRGVLTNTFIDDDSFYAGHDSPITPASARHPSHHTGRHTPSTSSTLRHRVFDSLHRACPDDLSSRLRLEYRRFLCERIDAFPRLCGGLLDDDEFGESGHKEGSRFLDFFVAYLGERLDDALDVLPRHIVWMLLSDFLNEFRLRHQLGHVSSVLPNHPVTTLA